MKVVLDKEGTYEGFKRAIAELTEDGETKGLLVFASTNNGFVPDQLDPLLATISMPIFGGCFPGIMMQEQVYERGTLVIGLPFEPQVQLIENIDQLASGVTTESPALISEIKTRGTKILLVDGMSSCVDTLLELVFENTGLEGGYIGGGASSLALRPEPCLFTNAGFKSNCAILASLGMTCGIGNSHGMKAIEGPHKITSAYKNKVFTINWQPAAEFYKSFVEKYSSGDAEKLGVLGMDAHFSLGLNRFESEHVILEPVQIEDNNTLGFMKEVREGELVDFMHITEEQMVKSAESALQTSLEDCGVNETPKTLISFDCVSRKLFLQDRFNEELRAICSQGHTHVGALTCGGEVGSSGSDFLEYHNRACVIGAFPV